MMRSSRLVNRLFSTTTAARKSKYPTNEELDALLIRKPKRKGSSDEPVIVRTYGGSRALELAQQKTGNLLTPRLVRFLDKKINQMAGNTQVGLGMFHCIDVNGEMENGIEYFCMGVDPVAYQNNRMPYVDSVLELAATLRKQTKNMISIYSGRTNGTGYAVFGGSRYHLATSQTHLLVNDLFQGHLPMGGLTHYFLKHNANSGLEFARYAATTASLLNPDEMHALGLLSHLVQDDAHEYIGIALARSSPVDLFYEIQPLEVYIHTLPELLQFMHVGSNINVMDHPAWDRLMHVKPLEIDMSKFEQTTTDGHVRDIEDIVKYCYSTDDASVALTRLREHATSYKVLHAGAVQFSKLDRKIAQKWFDLTRESEKLPLTEAYRVERKYISEL